MATQASTLNLWGEATPQPDEHDWTFIGAATRQLTHCYHDYPARMIPQIAGKLIDRFAANANLLFDPYCGSGTSLVEGYVRGINVIGTDLNPLARLIAEAKTSVPKDSDLDGHIARLHQFLQQRTDVPAVLEIEGISRLNFWFKPSVTDKLSKIRVFIDRLDDRPIQLFFQVAFSETVRESSNTRNEEFKLYRYEEARLDKFDPDVFGIMLAKLKRNRAGYADFYTVVKEFARLPERNVYDFNTVSGIPAEKIAPESVDIVVTSPPYGDSHTTVAYGQYSRLSAAWLGLHEPQKVDSKLMGGKTPKEMLQFPSPPLNAALSAIKENHDKRAREVAAFYSDLYNSISNVAGIVRDGGHVCYVVGNRKVKGVVLPTDLAVRHFFEQYGFDYVDTFHRSIPNKRMPLKNSPSNAPGEKDQTMTREYIVVMQRRVG